MKDGPRSPWSRRKHSLRAFTLIELLVVFSIMIALLAAVVVAGSTLVTRAKNRTTEGVLNIVREAVEQFQREQNESPTLVRARQGPVGSRVSYETRYGRFPPDELEVFTEAGLPGNGGIGRSLAVGGAEVLPGPAAGTYPAMLFHTVENPNPELEHRDLAALILAIELNSEVGSAMLDRIPNSSRSAGPLTATGDPMIWLNRGNDTTWTRGTDQQIRYVVDAWGVPISYLAQRDYDPTATPGAPPSGNHPAWNQASTEMIRLNGGQPILFSYGANGRDQLTKDALVDPAVSLVGDWMDPATANRRIDNPLNEDNVYADPGLKEKLATGQ